MDPTIAAVLMQDGITNGAIYALVGLAVVLVFSITRVVLVPQGEFVAFGALTLAALVARQLPGTVWLLLGAVAAAAAMDAVQAARERRLRQLPARLARWFVVPVAAVALALWSVGRDLPLWCNVLLTLLLVVPLGPAMYRVAFQPIAEASVLILLIVAVGVHFSLVGLGLVFFGAEGSRTPAFHDAQYSLGEITISGQSLVVFCFTLVLMGALFVFLGRTHYGRALRATAVNRRGARLMGISTAFSGQLSFALAALIGAVSGMLIAPLTAIYYDTGFLIGLKGFVASIIGGLASFPLTVAGALLVGQLESFASFWASPLKEVIVFTLILPVLLLRSLLAGASHDEH